jgi:hypothetical protein
MRTIIYGVFNKETNKRIYTNIQRIKCEEFVNAQENKENLEIRYKWTSI